MRFMIGGVQKEQRLDWTRVHYNNYGKLLNIGWWRAYSTTQVNARGLKLSRHPSFGNTVAIILTIKYINDRFEDTID